MRTTLSFSLLLAMALVAPTALAQTAINETRPLDARGRVDISNRLIDHKIVGAQVSLSFAPEPAVAS